MVYFTLINLYLGVQREQQCKEEDENKHVRGFREVIDLISASQKPVVAQNSLNGPFLLKELVSY